ncbi:pentatricopeptide repeat-containing protein At1g09900 [Selaginella moellendorffii]|nr:pentatricopeptide repeat-containing protein At1g09900 [Selaginella moellendorffii]XP_024519080.1 pentatricopeptide repeat-containing protein At1g09900 [Selaginella moellendorffii]XP_024519081.1 pentatricopeptide repeat-containing protein At1g09900 [Selaginella moellendorffii]|eukprot:XP_024519079.1 pentatricopeptide repeat-containing protein At1g09900 [Selaginella moellendorffii]
MALHIARTAAARSMDDIAVFKNFMHFLIEIVEPLVASPMHVFFLQWRSIAGSAQSQSLSAELAEAPDFKQRMFHQASFSFKNRDSHARYANAAAQISQLRQCAKSEDQDALARVIGDRLTPDFVLEMVKGLRNDPGTALFFYRWAGKQNRSSYKHDSRIYNQVVRNLAAAKRLSDIDSVLGEMMDQGCSLEPEAALDLVVCYANGAMVDRAQAIFNELRDQGQEFPAHIYNVIFGALAKLQRFQDVFRMVEDLMAKNFTFSDSTADALVRIFCKALAVDKAVRFLKWMSSKGLQVNAMALSMVVDSLCKAGKEDTAIGLLEDTAASSSVTLADRNFLCCSLICGVFRTGALAKASFVIRKLLQRGLVWKLSVFDHPEGGSPFSFEKIIALFGTMKVAMSTFEYNCLIEGLCKGDRIDEALRLYELMRGNNVPADIFTYNNMIECISKLGMVEQAEKVLKTMEESDCKPDKFIYTRVINGFCKLGNFKNAVVLLGRMKEAGYAPDAVVFDCIIGGLCKTSKFDEALVVLKVSIEAGCEPDEVTYFSIVDPLCNMEDWESALRVLELAQERKCPATNLLYSRLMKCLCKTGKVEAACQLLEDLTNGSRGSEQLLGGDGCKPDVVMYSIVIDALCAMGMTDEGFVVVKAMEERGVKPDAVVYTIFLYAFCRSARLDDACRLLEIMVEAGCYPDVISYNTLLFALCSAGQEEEACRLFQVMVETGIEPNVFTYTQLIRALCSTKKLEGARHLFNFMKLSKCVPDMETYKALILGHYQNEGVREARQLLEQESDAFSRRNPGKSLLSELHEAGNFYERKQLTAIIDQGRLA